MNQVTFLDCDRKDSGIACPKIGPADHGVKVPENESPVRQVGQPLLDRLQAQHGPY